MLVKVIKQFDWFERGVKKITYKVGTHDITDLECIKVAKEEGWIETVSEKTAPQNKAKEVTNNKKKLSQSSQQAQVSKKKTAKRSKVK